MHVKHDYEPCDTCKQYYVGIVALEPNTNVHKGVWQVTREAFAAMEIFSANMRKQALEHGFACISEGHAEDIGLFKVTRKASERNKTNA